MNINIKNASIEELNQELKLRQKEMEKKSEEKARLEAEAREAERQKLQAPLEAAFRNAVEEAMVQIQDKMTIAQKAIDEAAAISEKYGVPFHIAGVVRSDGFFSEIEENYRSIYTPESFRKKFGKMDREFIYEEYWENSPNDGTGWSHSSVC